MNGENMKDNICRDYLRNVCNRGSSCKFRHPDSEETKILSRKDLIFCHDFQNKECRRINCKFIHCTKQEEEYYRTSGYLPEHVLENIANKGYASIPNIPVCKDYLKGECKRGGRCKFRHLTAGQFQVENNNLRRDPFGNERFFDGFGTYEPQTKRQVYDNTFSNYGSRNSSGELHHILPQHYRLLQEENARLLHKIEELKKQVLNLTTTNQYLREQYEHLRGLTGKDWYMHAYQNSYLTQ